MTYTFKLSRRLSVLLALGAALVSVAACTPDDPTGASTGDTAEQVDGSPMTIVPRSVLVDVGQPITLRAFRRTGPRGKVPMDPVDVEWQASGGTIDAQGVFTSSTAGTFKVVGRGRGRQKPDTSDVVVVPPPVNLVQVIISPDSSTLVTGGSKTYAATGLLSDGSTAQLGVTWSSTGGSIDAGGVYTAGGTGGRYRVIAKAASAELADTAVVTLETITPTLTAVVLRPASVTLQPAAVQQYVAVGTLSNGDSTPVHVSFAVTGGTITPDGLFTAGSSSGGYRVVAKDSASGLADTSQVTILSSQPGTTVFPGQSIQAAVNAQPAGTAFLLKAGVHRLQSVIPKDGNSFTGEAGAIVSGARLLTNFTKSGGYWVADGQTQQNAGISQCQSGYAGCAYPEDLFIDNALLRHVTSLAEVAPGRWYFDYAGDKIYLADDPTGHEVETSVLAHAFQGSVRNVTLRNLTIEKYATPGQDGAIQGSGTSAWVVQDNEVRWNHAIGIRIGNGMQVLHNNAHHNGMYGMGGSGANVLVADNEIAYNNTVGFKPGWGAGGAKFTFTNGLVLRRNYAHHNQGQGLWTDIDNINTLYEYNTVEANQLSGIFHEISYKAVIRYNVCRNNGFGGAVWMDGSGILVNSSPDVEVYGNTVSNNFNGIGGIHSNRGSGAYGAHELRNLNVHDNTVTMSVGRTGIVQNSGTNDVFVSWNNQFARNSYSLGSNATYFVWMNSSRTSQDWRGFGLDVTGTFVP